MFALHTGDRLYDPTEQIRVKRMNERNNRMKRECKRNFKSEKMGQNEW